MRTSSNLVVRRVRLPVSSVDPSFVYTLLELLPEINFGISSPFHFKPTFHQAQVALVQETNSLEERIPCSDAK
ncbi:hypothetical protein KHA80_06855 [Anaerobacillus sp. HL2]|nr:hypothetical protein KHA80_06855 [Anaerobacillus sp. HL2]